MKTRTLFFFLSFLLIADVSISKNLTDVIPGAYQTDLYFPLLKEKTIALVANQTSLISGVHLADTLIKAGMKIKCVFAPEHGFRGNQGAGEEVDNSIDDATGIKIVSIYGSHSKPQPKDLAGIDIVVFDIQDVGVRFYTYISTLQYVMEACAENKVQLIVLDRPNPHGHYVDGPVLNRKFSSFIGMQPVPVVYGMTIGEYAKMLNGEGWLRKKEKCDLKVIPVRNYTHNSIYKIPVSPSPNLNDMDAIYLYPSTCFFEGTAVSLGRGTLKPFRLIGFPGNTGGNFFFTPQSIKGMAVNPPYMDTLCTGLDLSGEGAKILDDPGIKLKYLLGMYSVFPDKKKFFIPFFEKLAGTTQLREQIIAGKSEEEIRKSWQPGIKKFKVIRKKYLIYKDFE